MTILKFMTKYILVNVALWCYYLSQPICKMSSYLALSVAEMDIIIVCENMAVAHIMV